MTETTASSNPKAVLHGVLVSINRVGVLITGEPGSGKSEAALGLIAIHGHRLIADDVVEVSRTGDVLIGSGASGMEGLLHVRDLGILSAPQTAPAVREQCIDLIIHLEAGPNRCHEDDTDDGGHEILGKSLPRIVLYNCRTRNLALLVETAAARFVTKGNGIESDFLRKYDGDLLHG
ncbi:MAG TPA: hypothetical protein VNA17_06830 [Pyrinomonadaceae bacterium]|nr:hypothetical protein [Pyrinomonadaceae bacterium]